MASKSKGSRPWFDPNSIDSQFATIINQLKQQDKERWDYQQLEGEYRVGVQTKLDRIETAVNKTNGRVTALEQEAWKNRGIFAALAVGATGLWHFIMRK